MKYPEIDVADFTPQDLEILQLAKTKLSTTGHGGSSGRPRFICWAVKDASNELGLPDESYEKITRRILRALAKPYKPYEIFHGWMFDTNPDYYKEYVKLPDRHEYAQTHRHIWLDQIIQKVQDEISRHKA